MSRVIKFLLRHVVAVDELEVRVSATVIELCHIRLNILAATPLLVPLGFEPIELSCARITFALPWARALENGDRIQLANVVVILRRRDAAVSTDPAVRSARDSVATSAASAAPATATTTASSAADGATSPAEAVIAPTAAAAKASASLSPLTFADTRAARSGMHSMAIAFWQLVTRLQITVTDVACTLQPSMAAADAACASALRFSLLRLTAGDSRAPSSQLMEAAAATVAAAAAAGVQVSTVCKSVSLCGVSVSLVRVGGAAGRISCGIGASDARLRDGYGRRGGAAGGDQSGSGALTDGRGEGVETVEQVDESDNCDDDYDDDCDDDNQSIVGSVVGSDAGFGAGSDAGLGAGSDAGLGAGSDAGSDWCDVDDEEVMEVLLEAGQSDHRAQVEVALMTEGSQAPRVGVVCVDIARLEAMFTPRHVQAISTFFSTSTSHALRGSERGAAGAEAFASDSTPLGASIRKVATIVMAMQAQRRMDGMVEQSAQALHDAPSADERAAPQSTNDRVQNTTQPVEIPPRHAPTAPTPTSPAHVVGQSAGWMAPKLSLHVDRLQVGLLHQPESDGAPAPPAGSLWLLGAQDIILRSNAPAPLHDSRSVELTAAAMQLTERVHSSAVAARTGDSSAGPPSHQDSPAAIGHSNEPRLPVDPTCGLADAFAEHVSDGTSAAPWLFTEALASALAPSWQAADSHVLFGFAPHSHPTAGARLRLRVGAKGAEVQMTHPIIVVRPASLLRLTAAVKACQTETAAVTRVASAPVADSFASAGPAPSHPSPPMPPSSLPSPGQPERHHQLRISTVTLWVDSGEVIDQLPATPTEAGLVRIGSVSIGLGTPPVVQWQWMSGWLFAGRTATVPVAAAPRLRFVNRWECSSTEAGAARWDCLRSVGAPSQLALWPTADAPSSLVHPPNGPAPVLASWWDGAVGAACRLAQRGDGLTADAGECAISLTPNDLNLMNRLIASFAASSPPPPGAAAASPPTSPSSRPRRNSTRSATSALGFHRATLLLIPSPGALHPADSQLGASCAAETSALTAEQCWEVRLERVSASVTTGEDACHSGRRPLPGTAITLRSQHCHVWSTVYGAGDGAVADGAGSDEKHMRVLIRPILAAGSEGLQVVTSQQMFGGRMHAGETVSSSGRGFLGATRESPTLPNTLMEDADRDRALTISLSMPEAPIESVTQPEERSASILLSAIALSQKVPHPLLAHPVSARNINAATDASAITTDVSSPH